MNILLGQGGRIFDIRLFRKKLGINQLDHWRIIYLKRWISLWAVYLWNRYPSRTWSV